VRQSTALDTLRARRTEPTPPADPPPKKGTDRMFTITFMDAAEHLAKEVRTLSALRLFHVLPRLLSHQEWRRLDQRAVAAELKTTQGVISTALAELLALGVVEKRGKANLIEWRLSPDYTWKGSTEEYWKATDEGRRKLFPPGGPTTLEGRIRDIMETTSGETLPNAFHRSWPP